MTRSFQQWWLSCFTSFSSSSIPNHKLRFSQDITPIISFGKPSKPKTKPKPNGATNSSSPSSFTSSASSSISSSHRKSNYFSRQPPPPKSLRSRQSTTEAAVDFQKSLQPIITEIPKRRSKSMVSPRGGVKLRSNTPRVRRRRQGVAVVKCSRDPWRDFRDSMVEMIVENNLTEKKDLEELLACYLTLNSEEYHDLIIHVFKQLWFDFVAIK